MERVLSGGCSVGIGATTSVDLPRPASPLYPLPPTGFQGNTARKGVRNSVVSRGISVNG